MFLEKDINISKIYKSNYSYRAALDNKILYRYEAHLSEDCGLDMVYLISFNVVRITPKCFVICYFGQDKFVLKDARKRYAYPELKDALNSFKIRCNWRKRHAERDLDRANRALNLVKEIENE